MLLAKLLPLLLTGTPIVLSLLAIVLIYFGWSRRYGEAPHCRECNYCLDQTQATSCPECGVDLKGNPPAKGAHRPNEALLIAALVCIAIVICFLISFTNDLEIDWYDLATDGQLITELQGTKNYAGTRAWRELESRMHDGELSQANLDAINALVLNAFRAERRAAGFNANVDDQHEWIRDQIENDSLSPDYWDQLTTIATKRAWPTNTDNSADGYFAYLAARVMFGHADETFKARLINDTLGQVTRAAESPWQEKPWLLLMQHAADEGWMSDEQLELFKDDAFASQQLGQFNAQVGWLHEQYLNGKLTPWEQQRLFKQMAVFTMEARTPVLSGETTPVRYHLAIIAPEADDLWFRTQLVHSPDHDQNQPADALEIDSQGTEYLGAWSDVLLPEGSHLLKATIRIWVYRGVPGDLSNSDLIAEVDTHAVASAEVLPADSLDPVVARPDPSLRIFTKPKLEALIWDEQTGELSARFADSLKLPHRAFDVVAQIDDEQYAMTPLTFGDFWDSRGSSVGRTPEADSATLVLTPSATAIKQTLSQFEYWDGEPFVYKDISIPEYSSLGGMGGTFPEWPFSHFRK